MREPPRPRVKFACRQEPRAPCGASVVDLPGKEVEKRRAAFKPHPTVQGAPPTVGGRLATPAAESGKHGRQAGVVSVEYAEM